MPSCSALRAEAGDPRIVLTFPVELPANTSAEQVEQWLSASGFTKVQAERERGEPARKVLDVVADRFRLGNAEKARAWSRRLRWRSSAAAGG